MPRAAVWDYRAMAEGSLRQPAVDYPWFRGVTTAWDNSARKNDGWVFHGCEPGSYGDWLEGQCRYAIENLPPEQRLVFINAWNEWAEGTYLEPDARCSYEFLNRTGEDQQFKRTGAAGQLPIIDETGTTPIRLTGSANISAASAARDGRGDRASRTDRG